MDIIEKKRLGMTFYEFNGRTYDTRRAAEDAKRAYEARLNKDVEAAQAKADKANAALEQAKAKVNPTTPDAMEGEASHATPDVASMSDDDLVAKRNSATGEARQLFQDEINKRAADGQPHSWDAADKALAEKRAEEAKAAEIEAAKPVEQPEIQEQPAVQNEEQPQVPNLSDKEKAEIDNNKQVYKDSYWRNLIYGNGHGSVKGNKDAKEEKAAKYDEFLKDNPSLIKAIFGKDSGLNAGQRLLHLGELLASIGADAFKGAYAGFNKQTLPDATQGRNAKIYNKALNAQYERKQEQFNAEQEAKNTAAKNKSIIDANPTLSVLPDSVRTTLSENLVNGLTEEEFASLLAGTGFESQAAEMYRSFKNAVNNNASVTSQQGNVEDVRTKKLNNQFAAIDGALKTAKDCNDYVSAINEKIKDLEAFKLQLADANQDQYFQYIERYLGYLSGVQTVANNAEAHRDSNWNVATEVKGGIPVVHGSVSGGGGHDWGSSEGQNTFTDALRAANIPVAEQGASDWTKNRGTYIKALESEIDKQIQYWKDAKVAAEARAKALSGKADASVNDGVIKAPHMKQWLVREDGTKIELNPSDTIYATKNEITTEKDDGSDVVPIEKEDKVVVIQKKLGYDGGNINKSFDYYLNKLRG